jgi:DNA-binding response OmpR family regulator
MKGTVRPKGSILVIEDEPFIRNMIATHLEYQGYQVFKAENGQEGFSFQEQHTPDAIVCDILMPREDGIAFCRRIRAAGIRTPILILSAKNQAENIVEGLAIGQLANDF